MLFSPPSAHFCPAFLLPSSYMKHFLIHCFVFPIVLHPMTHCTGKLGCLLGMFWRAGAEVWAGRRGSQRFRGRQDPYSLYILPADALESSLLLLLVSYSWSSPRSGTILLPTPPGRGIQHGTTNQEGSGLALPFQPLVFPYL